MNTSDEPVRGPREPGARAGRFHSARGPMPLSGWLRLPAARLRARLGSVPERPWIVPAAVGWLGRRIRRDWSVLELGSGRSTVWLGRRAGPVLTFEDDQYWHDRAAERIAEEGLRNVRLRRLPVAELASAVDSMPDETFDLVFVDFLEAAEADRIDAVRAARSKVRPGGLLVLDDSDRPGYAEAYELLEGWRERRFTGVKDEYPQVCETAIFRRPE